MQQLVPGAGVGIAALVKHVAAVADPQALLRVLLDHDDRDPGVVDLLDPVEDHALVGRRQAG